MTCLASSTVWAILFLLRSGAKATKPSAASRSHSVLKNGFNPHQAWSTITPGPLDCSGSAKYPFTGFPSTSKLTSCPFIVYSPLIICEGILTSDSMPGQQFEDRTPGDPVQKTNASCLDKRKRPGLNQQRACQLPLRGLHPGAPPIRPY